MQERLFQAQTIQQFKIHQWLVAGGLAKGAVADVDFPEKNMVKITDTMGDSLTLTLEKDGTVREEYNIK